MFNIPGKYIVTIFVAAVIIALLFVRSVRKWLAIRFKTFDYLWDYIEAAYAHLNDIFWGVAVTGAAFAIPFFIIGIVSQFTYIPSWLNWLAVLAASLVAGYYVWRPYHVRLIPKGEITETTLAHSGIDKVTYSATVSLPPSVATIESSNERTFVQVEFKCLTETPLHECTGYLKQVRRLSSGQWEAAEFVSLVLKWDNENEVREITQYPSVEKPLNVIQIWHTDNRVEICCFGDLSRARQARFFEKGIKEYEFDIQINYADRVNDITPASACLRVELTDDPSKPTCHLRDTAE